LAWAFAAKLIDSSEAQKLAKDWTADKSAADFFAPIKDFRTMLHEMVVRLSREEKLKPATIEKINRTLRENTGYVEIAPTDEGFEKIFRASYKEPRELLAPVAESWADLLCYGNLELLKKCEGAGCVLFFYDTTKNHRRRWCSQKGCGNRAKAAAFYQRRREKSKAGNQQNTNERQVLI
jgi:predicted RNA-binding Zn ribbon-like protein